MSNDPGDEDSDERTHSAFDALLTYVDNLPAGANNDEIKRFVFMFEPLARQCMTEEIESHTDVVNWVCAAGSDFVQGKDPPWGLMPMPIIDEDEGEDEGAAS